ncbi:hypothetical protein H257_19336, partial [Aphanomyces astaci]
MPSPRSLTAFVPRTGNKKLSDEQRHCIYETLLERSEGGDLPHGCITRTARLFNCSSQTISNVWARGRSSLREGSATAAVSAKYKGNTNRKVQHTDEEIESLIRAVPLYERQTLRTLAAKSGLSKSTIIRHMQRAKTLKLKSSYSKPLLTEANTKTRMEHALSFLRPSSKGTIFDN